VVCSSDVCALHRFQDSTTPPGDGYFVIDMVYGYFVVMRLTLHIAYLCAKIERSSFSLSRDTKEYQKRENRHDLGHPR